MMLTEDHHVPKYCWHACLRAETLQTANLFGCVLTIRCASPVVYWSGVLLCVLECCGRGWRFTILTRMVPAIMRILVSQPKN